MKKITNNEGRTIQVPADLYNELQAMYVAGDWAAIIEVDSQKHTIIIPDNFHS